MAHKTDNTKQVYTYSFKCKNTTDLWMKTINQYIAYYNTLSTDIANNLLTMKIGDLMPHLENKESLYYKVCEKNANQPLYYAFKVGGDNFKNALYEYFVKYKNIYKGNSLNFTPTHFCRNGFYSSVFSNFCTKFSTYKLTIKRKKVSKDSSLTDLFMQVMYELNQHSLFEVDDWNNYIDYCNKTIDNEEYKERINLLFDVYMTHQQEIKQQYDTFVAEDLQSFVLNGCQRNCDKKSMTIQQIQDLKFNWVEGTNDCEVFFNKHIGKIELYGNKQITKDCTLLVNPNNVCESVTFVIKNNTMFVNLQFKNEYSKPIIKENNVVGFDINTKHCLLNSSLEDDGNLNGYINIYKELMKNKTFTTLLKKFNGLFDIYNDLSNLVTFGIIETPFLFEKYAYNKGYSVNNDFNEIENIITETLLNLEKSTNDIKKKDYIHRTYLMRKGMYNYFYIKMRYFEEQKEYDTTMYNSVPNKDEVVGTRQGKDFTKGQEFLEKHPFKYTDNGLKLLKLLNDNKQNIIGNRNNIIVYATNILTSNGYNLFSFEDLNSSNFERSKSIPTITSLLKYHKFEGKSKDDFLHNELFEKFGNCYKLTFENGIVVNAEYSKLGLYKTNRTLFYNILIKSVSFADVKDYFVTLSNKNNFNVVFVPKEYTSQMDSNTHKVYVEEKVGKNNTKIVSLVKKDKVRKTQEYHINGLNADFNSARNIAFIASNQQFSTALLVKPKKYGNGFGKPLLVPTTKNIQEVVAKIKKIGAIQLFSEV